MQGQLNCVFSFLHFTLSLTIEYRQFFFLSDIYVHSTFYSLSFVSIIPFLHVIPSHSAFFLNFSSTHILPSSNSSNSLFSSSTKPSLESLPSTDYNSFFSMCLPFHLYLTISVSFPIFCSPSFDFPLDSNNGLTIE